MLGLLGQFEHLVIGIFIADAPRVDYLRRDTIIVLRGYRPHGGKGLVGLPDHRCRVSVFGAYNQIVCCSMGSTRLENWFISTVVWPWSPGRAILAS